MISAQNIGPVTDALRHAERYRNVVVVLVLMAWPVDRHTHRVWRDIPDAILALVLDVDNLVELLVDLHRIQP